MRGLFLGILYGIGIRSFLKVIVGVKYLNREALKKEKQFVIVSNHNSHIDTLAIMGALPFGQVQHVHPIAAGDYFGSSKIKAGITQLFTNAILIRRSKNTDAPNPIELMSAAVTRGESLILFPEGSRGTPGKMQEFKKGIGILLQMHPELFFIPIYMRGMGKVLPNGERLLVPFDTYVHFGNPRKCKATEVETIVKEIEEAILQLN